MITRVELTNFKRFKNKSICLHPNTISFVVGGNNSGKSTVLHALAVWEFCKTLIVFERGKEALYAGQHTAGEGISFDDFTPINIPSFKYLWTNLKAQGSYTLHIKVVWLNKEQSEKYLTIALSLVQERLFMKNTDSNLAEDDEVPRIAYLPPFAGISDKEQWHSQAMRRKFIGQGLAGAVLRNVIIELNEKNRKTRKEKQGANGRLSNSELRKLRATDPYELLQQTLYNIFRCQLYPKSFNPEYHTRVQVNLKKGSIEKLRFTPYKDYRERDIMVEGSGFLQWLSVYTFALSPRVDVLLLDEPDAHLHTSLQQSIVDELKQISTKQRKQILFATHSNEIIKNADFADILFVKSSSEVKYLQEENQKTVVLSGLGTEYFPKWDAIERYKRILFVENESDAEFLKIWMNKTTAFPHNIVIH